MKAEHRNRELRRAIERLAFGGELCATLDQLARQAELSKSQIRSGLTDLIVAGEIEAIGQRGQITVYRVCESHGANSENHTVQRSRENPNTPYGGVGFSPYESHEKSHGPTDPLIGKAEARIRNSLMHFDREDEVIEDLFGRRGLLRAFAGDQRLQRRMLALWRGARHQGERMEEEAAERLVAYGDAYFRRVGPRKIGKPAPLDLAELVSSNGNGNGHRTLDQDLSDLLGFDADE